MAKEKKTKLGVWVILGILFFSLVGFGTTSLTGTSNRLASVGQKEITLNQYALELRQAMDTLRAQLGIEISFAQAQSAGISDEVLANLVNRRVLENEASVLGLSMGDEPLRERLANEPAFQGLAGGFDRAAYKDALARIGTNESDYEQLTRDEMAATLLQLGIVGGIETADGFAALRSVYLGERRDITWAILGSSVLTEALPEPTEEELIAYHEAHKDQFTTPETKSLTFAVLLPSTISETVEVDEQAIRDLYQERIDDYVVPERRLVERLGFADEAAAQAAMEAITAGTTDFNTLVAERGLSLDDVDLGDVSRVELAEAGEAVFAASTDQVVGPLPSLVGPALFRVNAILAADETAYDDARDELRAELAQARARRVISDSVEGLTDLVAGGATLEDLVANSQMELGTMAITADSTDGMAAYPEFRDAAAAAQIGDYPELVELSDGGVFALRVDAINEPAVQPLEDVYTLVRSAWRNEAMETAILTKAQELAAAMTLDTDFAALGLTAKIDPDVTRRSFIDRTPEGFTQQVFATEAGGSFAMPYNGAAVLVRVDAVKAADPENADVIALRKSEGDAASAGIAQDIFQITLQQLIAKTEIQVDPAAVNAVHSSLQ